MRGPAGGSIKSPPPKASATGRFWPARSQSCSWTSNWWVNRKDPTGRNIFSGGFLGLDNIGLFDRSQPLPSEYLQQADATAWMAFFCGTMLSMALDGQEIWPLKVRSCVGLLPLIAVEIIEQEAIDRLPGFKKCMQWFLKNRRDLAQFIPYMESRKKDGSEQHWAPKREESRLGTHYLLAIPLLTGSSGCWRYLLDENEFLSPFGIRSLSKFHKDHPFSIWMGGTEHRVQQTARHIRRRPVRRQLQLCGPIPIWFPVNYLLIEALQRYNHYYGPSLQVEFPTGSGHKKTLGQIALELSRRLTHLFLPDEAGHRPPRPQPPVPCESEEPILFHEYFHAETGEGPRRQSPDRLDRPDHPLPRRRGPREMT